MGFSMIQLLGLPPFMETPNWENMYGKSHGNSWNMKFKVQVVWKMMEDAISCHLSTVSGSRGPVN